MKLALCVGINYPGTSSELQNCVSDARAWTAALTKRGFKTCTVIDAAATGKNLRAGIGDIIAAAKSGDTVVFSYSGHGSYVPDEDGDEADGADECICPVDIFTNGPITDDELYRLYTKAAPGVKLVVISDSCHSGTVTRFMAAPSAPVREVLQTRVDRVRFMPPRNFLTDYEASKLNNGFRRSLPAGHHACLLLSGCADPEYSYDGFNGQPNGAFTSVALKTLEKLPAKSIYLQWWVLYRQMLPTAEYPQSPALFGSSAQRAWLVFE